jgi:hypothetical protein
VRYSLEQLEHLQGPVDTVSAKLREVGALPTMEQVRSLATWDEGFLAKFERGVGDLGDQDRSGALAELSYLMAEHGWSDEQMYVGLTNADDRWGKFVGRYNRHSILTDLVNRARQKIGYGVSGIDVAAIVARIEGGGDQPGKIAYRYGEFMARTYNTSWQVEGLMPAKGIGLVVAPPGTGKTQFAFGLASTLASGRPRFLQWSNPGGPKRVLVLSLEMNEEGTWSFLSQQDGSFTEPERALLRENYVVEPLGEAMPLDEPAGQEWFGTSPSWW